MKWVNVLALVLGSAWFFPVSCTGTLYLGIEVFAKLDAREVAHGDQVHSGFSVVAEPGAAGTPFRLVLLSDLQRFRVVGEPYSLLLSKSSDRLQVGQYSHIGYRVLERQAGFQIVEAEDHNDDRTIWSRYRTTGADVVPLESRMWYMGYMVSAMPYALGSAFLWYGLGLWLRRRLAAPPSTLGGRR